GIVDDPRLPMERAGVVVEGGKRIELTFRLPLRDDTPPPARHVLRPALGIPVIRKPGESFPLHLRRPQEKSPSVSLLASNGETRSLAVGPPSTGPLGPFCPVSLPPATPPGAYGLLVEGPGWRETLPPVVHILQTHPETYAIAHISDTHIGNRQNDWRAFRFLLAIAKELERKKPAFAVITGDLTDHGIPSEFLRFRRSLRAFPVPVFVCEGNHDHFGGGIDRFYRGRDTYPCFMGMRMYPIHFGEDRFAVLGTGVYEELDPRQARWATAFLKGESPGLKGMIYHYDYTCTLPVRGGPVPGNQVGHLAAKLGVDLLLEGHLHKPRTRRVATAVAHMAPAARDGGYSWIALKGGEVQAATPFYVPAQPRTPPAWNAKSPPGGIPGEGIEKVKALFRRGADAETLGRTLRSARDWRVRRAAATAIARAGWTREMREVLEAGAGDPHPFVREAVVMAWGTDTLLAPLQKAVKDSDPRVREGCIKALGQVRGKGAFRILVERLRDPEPRVARSSASVISGFRSEGASDVIARAALEGDLPAAVRRILIRGLGDRDGKRLGPILLPLLREPDRTVRAEGGLLLGEWKVWASIPELIRLLEEGMASQQRKAHWILVRLTREDFGFGTAKDRENWEAWWDREGKRKGRD
ncbi:MAG: HEAT repeat domain-containing protein, partial [Planctomycetota bacterium]